MDSYDLVQRIKAGLPFSVIHTLAKANNLIVMQLSDSEIKFYGCVGMCFFYLRKDKRTQYFQIVGDNVLECRNPSENDIKVIFGTKLNVATKYRDQSVIYDNDQKITHFVFSPTEIFVERKDSNLGRFPHLPHKAVDSMPQTKNTRNL